MKYNDREKAIYSLKSSVALFIFSTFLFIMGLIYVAVFNRFPFWWIIAIIVFIQTVCTIIYCYFMISKIDVYSDYLDEKIRKAIFWIIIVELLTLNAFAFVYGAYNYRKIYLRTKYL